MVDGKDSVLFIEYIPEKNKKKRLKIMAKKFVDPFCKSTRKVGNKIFYHYKTAFHYVRDKNEIVKDLKKRKIKYRVFTRRIVQPQEVYKVTYIYCIYTNPKIKK